MVSDQFSVSILYKDVVEYINKLSKLKSYLNITQLSDFVSASQDKVSHKDFWVDTDYAIAFSKKINDAEHTLNSYNTLLSQCNMFKTMLESLSEEDGLELKEELVLEMNSIIKLYRKLEEQYLFIGEFDAHTCFVTIQAGAGGTEACDWVYMLYKMYIGWANINEFKTIIVDLLEDEIAGFKKVTFKVIGKYAYGYCKCEAGVHRLVRKSPFDANNRRHTSFASLYILPELDDDHLHIELRDEDLEMSTCRASGAGGQHVNKRDSAVRIKHLPTGIVAASQQERSQAQNRVIAIKLLKLKLLEIQTQKRVNKLSELGGLKTEIGWGHQIRSYVFEPYELIKDLRSGYNIANVAQMMSGNAVMDFMYSVLRSK